VDDIKSFWVTDMTQKADSSIDLGGISLQRSKIQRIVNIFDKATLQSVLVDSIRGQQVYKFKVNVQKVDMDK
jgi:hypothetical protein